MTKQPLKRYLLPSSRPASDWDTCRLCAARILWVSELGLWLDERQYGGAAPRGQTPQVPEHRDVCGKVKSPRDWKAPRATLVGTYGGVPVYSDPEVDERAGIVAIILAPEPADEDPEWA